MKLTHVLSRFFRRLAPLALIVLVPSVVAGAAPERIGSVRFGTAATFDSDQLANDGRLGAPWTWLSIPGSRLVLNPYNRILNGHPPTLSADLPMHVGYFVGRRAPRFDRVMWARVPGAATNAPVRFTWLPSRLEQEAIVSGVEVHATDFLAEESTALRVLRFRPKTPGAAVPQPEVGGALTGEANVVDGVVRIVDPECAYAIAAARRAPDGRVEPIALRADEGEWAMTLPALEAGGFEVVVAIAFATPAEGVAVAAERARRGATGRPVAEALAERKAAWDGLLAKVPTPENFGIKAVEALGVTVGMHRHWYYGAWVFVLSQVLPPFPENNYAHYSFAEGKPSRWTNGEAGARAQCAWTSFMVSGLLSPIWPEWAWDAYEGVMSRVEASGELHGESLPSRKAQAAWVLYDVTGDRERLRRVYPALRRYLIWREQNPRWILPRGDNGSRHDIPDEKDTCFVVSHLIDVGHAMRVAEALGMPEEVKFWQAMTERELANYRQWFFPPDSDPMNFYFTSHGTHVLGGRTAQEPTYILIGLGFRGMPADLVTRLQEYYAKFHDRAKPMAGFPFIKYGDSSLIAYGLLNRGMQPQAYEFIDAQLRDTILAGDFGEELTLTKEGRVQASGVEPTLFLALQMIDFTLLRNGVRTDLGRPQRLAAPGN